MKNHASLLKSVAFANLSGVCALSLVLSLAAGGSARAQTDNFNDGDDQGWTHYSPLASFGAPGTFTFPGGAYRIQYPAFNHPQLSVSRGATYRAEISYSDFSVSMDVLDYNDASDTWFGLGARLGTLGLGTTSGYYFHYYPARDELHIDAIVKEATSNLATVSGVVLNPTSDYRMVFGGQGGNLSAALFDLTNLSSPIATLQASDTRYSSGFSGIVVASPAGVIDVTVDNFVATVPEPSSTVLALFGFAGLMAWRFRGSMRRTD